MEQHLIPALQALAYLVVSIIFVMMIKSDVRVLKVEMAGIKDNLKVLNSILTSVAVQDQRLNRLEDDIKEMKHGKGFIANGEYTRKGKID